MTTKQYVKIIAGPSAGEIFDACKYAFNKPDPFRVQFGGIRVSETGSVVHNGSKGKFSAQIVGVSHEDGSGTSLIILANVSIKSVDRTVEFYYNAKDRTGYLPVS